MLKKALLAALFAAPALNVWAETHLIDVRSPEEYAEAHADGAINIPVEDVAAKISAVTADKDADIYVYCRSGRRAEAARETLASLGYKKVTNLGTLADAQAHVAKAQTDKAEADSKAVQ
ncbi:rhodanese-like domain-containing protein [Cardiobacterium valvarum]|nr:rhodanese-like domain-containing protein [Cardiobacterium valvarum]